MNGQPIVPCVHHYSVFGLNVRSSVPLPELFPAAQGKGPDVTISIGPELEADDPVPAVTDTDGGIIISIPEIGRFRISGGNEISIEPVAGVPDRNLRLYLLGSVFGALLHQRGLLPLHANAVEIDGRAHVGLAERAAPAKLVEHTAKAIAQALKHPLLLPMNRQTQNTPADETSLAGVRFLRVHRCLSEDEAAPTRRGR